MVSANSVMLIPHTVSTSKFAVNVTESLKVFLPVITWFCENVCKSQIILTYFRYKVINMSECWWASICKHVKNYSCKQIQRSIACHFTSILEMKNSWWGYLFNAPMHWKFAHQINWLLLHEARRNSIPTQIITIKLRQQNTPTDLKILEYHAGIKPTYFYSHKIRYWLSICHVCRS